MNAPQSLPSELRLLASLEESQWWTPRRLARAQREQLAGVVAHARETVPFYRERLQKAWPSLPILTRREVQDGCRALQSRAVPPTHGRRYRLKSSGSTGEPVTIIGTERCQLFWRALTLREHAWHGRDLAAKLCVIRFHPGGDASPPDGLVRRSWGPATDMVERGGTLALLHIGTDVGEQVQWLLRHKPQYLLSYPSNLAAIADRFRDSGLELRGLRQVRTIGETLSRDEARRILAAWGAPVVDLYSSEEVGIIAMQCPSGSGLYHLQSENLLVEVLDGKGATCGVGETGRVVVSTLHNYAMPLLRYDLGDYAEVGPACPCGRGLPTLSRVQGRKRNMLVMPGGERRWPTVGHREYREVAPVRRYQLVQHCPESIEMRMVADRALTPQEESALTEVIQRSLGYPFRVGFSRLDAFAPGPRGKFEDFISLVTPT